MLTVAESRAVGAALGELSALPYWEALPYAREIETSETLTFDDLPDWFRPLAEEHLPSVTAAGGFNPKQARIPAGNGPYSGRWFPMPGGIADLLAGSSGGPQPAFRPDNNWGLPYAVGPRGSRDEQQADWEQRIGSTLTPEQRDQYEANVQAVRKAVADSDVVVQIDRDKLRSLVEKGRYIPIGDPELPEEQWKGASYFRERADVESISGVPDDQHPVYGWLRDPDRVLSDTASTDYYGDTALVLKQKAKDRASVTFGDSMNDYLTMLPIGKFAQGDSTSYEDEKAGLMDIPRLASSELDQWQTALPAAMGDYSEAQIHGGVTLDDIDHIEVPLHRLSIEAEQELHDLFDPLGIPIEKSKR